MINKVITQVEVPSSRQRLTTPILPVPLRVLQKNQHTAVVCIKNTKKIL